LVSLLKNQQRGNTMQNDKIYSLASELYFYFINLYNFRKQCVVENDDYSENTDIGRELYYQIEDELIKRKKKYESKRYN